MKTPSLCIIFEATGPYSAIGRIAMHQAELAIAHGWRVSVVAKRLSTTLKGRVDWLKLYVPPKGFALQWLSARYLIGKAIGDKRRFDVIITHQPQARDLSQFFQCHFLTRAAYESRCLIDSKGPRASVEWLQKRFVLIAEDRIFRRWPASVKILFNSDLTRDRFQSFYTLPQRQDVLLYQNPKWDPVEPHVRDRARKRFGIPAQMTVIGFLGGLQSRKGLSRLIPAIESLDGAFLLMGGLHSQGFLHESLRGRMHSLGLVEDTSEFYAACDILALPSVFEPYGYVACESVARGVPVIAAEQVGVLPHILKHQAGAVWRDGVTIETIVREIMYNIDQYKYGCKAFTDAYSAQVQDQLLMQNFEECLIAR